MDTDALLDGLVIARVLLDLALLVSLAVLNARLYRLVTALAGLTRRQGELETQVAAGVKSRGRLFDPPAGSG